MSRNDFNPKENAKMGTNSKANKDVANAAREVGVSKEELSRAVHKEKKFDFHGDLPYSELVELAKEIKAKENKKK